MRFIKIASMYKNKEQGSYIDKIDNINITDLIDGMELGEDSYKISVVEMSETEFEKLPEFTGF